MAGRPCAALVSGGLDSAVLVATVARRHGKVVPVYLRQGFRWEAVELAWLHRWLAVFPESRVARLVVLELPATDLIPGHWSITGIGVPRAADPDEAVWLPGRNLLLVVKTAVYCALHRIPKIAIGTLHGNPFTDAQPAFRRALGRALSVGLGYPITLVAPLASCSKAAVIRRGRSLPLGWTFSCIDPRGRMHCGRCQKCEERRRGFRDAGMNDPTKYAS